MLVDFHVIGSAHVPSKVQGGQVTYGQDGATVNPLKSEVT